MLAELLELFNSAELSWYQNRYLDKYFFRTACRHSFNEMEIWNQVCWNLAKGIKIEGKVEFVNSQSRSYLSKAKDTDLSKLLGRIKFSVKYRNGVLLHSHYFSIFCFLEPSFEKHWLYCFQGKRCPPTKNYRMINLSECLWFWFFGNFWETFQCTSIFLVTWSFILWADEIFFEYFVEIRA